MLYDNPAVILILPMVLAFLVSGVYFGKKTPTTPKDLDGDV